MSEMVYDRDYVREIGSFAKSINNPNIQALIPYFYNIDYFVQKEIESDWKILSTQKQIDELNQQKEERVSVLAVSHSQDSSLILDAINLVNEFDRDWKEIITATPNPLEVEQYIELTNLKENYPVFDKAWDFYDVITQIIEVGYQKQSLFGNYQTLYKNIESLKPTRDYDKAKQLLRQLQRTLKRCLPSEESMIEQTRRTPHITGDHNLNKNK